MESANMDLVPFGKSPNQVLGSRKAIPGFSILGVIFEVFFRHLPAGLQFGFIDNLRQISLPFHIIKLDKFNSFD